MQEVITETIVVAATALFGGDPVAPPSSSGKPPLRFGHGSGVRVVRFPNNPLGCAPYSETLPANEAVVVWRGDCTFLEKLILAQRAGASGVIVLGDENHHINPSADRDELEDAGTGIDDAAVVVLRKGDSEQVARMLDSAEQHGLGTVMLVVEPSGGPMEVDKDRSSEGDGKGAKDSEEKDRKEGEAMRVLYLNNHPLLNTRLIV